MKSSFDVIVIGSGVAGMTAAIYLKRGNVNVGIIESTAPGGQLNRVNKIDNYPGVIDSDGPSLAFNMFSQMQELNVPYIYGEVVKIIDNGLNKLITTNREEIEAKVIVIATGRKPNETGLEIEKKLIGSGISYCAICDGALYKNKKVAVYTRDYHGIEEAKYLSKIASTVYVVGMDGDNFDNIEFYNCDIEEISEFDNKIKSITVNKKNLEIDGLFVLLGSKPSTEFVELKTDNGYILVDNNMKTSINGIFACGDVISKGLYQVSTAVGEGAIAANSAILYLNERK